MTSACERANKCEVCDELHMGALLDPKLTFCCFECVEEGQAQLDCDGEFYRATMTCRCGKTGAINYDDGQSVGYFCGSSERCIP